MLSRPQLWLVLLAPAFGAAALFVAPADAGPTHSASCANLQTKLDAASAGETLVLHGRCSGSYTLPAGAAFTLEGATGTQSGFGPGPIDTPQLTSTAIGGVGAMTLSHLSFEDDDVDGEAVYLAHTTGALTLEDDTFDDDQSTASPVVIDEGAPSDAGCASADGRSLVIDDSSFSDNKTSGLDANSPDASDGGALTIIIECGHDPVDLAGDAFTHDTLESQAAVASAGGLLVLNADSTVASVTQTEDTFADDVVGDSGATGSDYEGGGEAVVDASLMSTGDQFSANTLNATVGSAVGGSGGGLVLVDAYCKPPVAQSTLTDDVLAANTIDVGTAPANTGAALSAGSCPASQLSLLDSTVTLNSVTPAASGAIAGIEVAPATQLDLENSILYGDQGGSELAGTNVAASYSDVCSGMAPLSGEGNICTDPALADDGSPTSANVHEMATSPTIDAGSDALVPAGLASDFYGGQRELSGASGACPQVPGSVDIGADEYSPCSAGGPPKLSKLRLSAISFFPANSGGPSATAPGSGTTISYTDSVSDTSTIELFSVHQGVKHHGACVAAKLGLPGPQCTLHVAIGSLMHADVPGDNKVHFSGRIAGQALPGGLYQVRVVATLDGLPGNSLKAEFDVF